MGVERDQPDSRRAAAPSPSTPGRVTALLPPTSSVSACASTLAATASRIGPVASSMVSPAISTSPRSAIRVDKLAPGLDVVAPDPLQRRAQQRRRLVARARRHRPGAERRADQPDRRVASSRATSRSARLGQLAHRFDASSRARLRATRMWDRLLDRLPRRDDGAGAAAIRSASSTNAAIGIADGKIVRVGKRTELAGFRAQEVVPLGGAWVTPGPDRLPHPSGVRRHPRRRACHAPRRRDL